MVIQLISINVMMMIIGEKNDEKIQKLDDKFRFKFYCVTERQKKFFNHIKQHWMYNNINANEWEKNQRSTHTSPKHRENFLHCRYTHTHKIGVRDTIEKKTNMQINTRLVSQVLVRNRRTRRIRRERKESKFYFSFFWMNEKLFHFKLPLTM